tara:strand:+ start:2448 stop:3284 length:837 start_codon:yes stop_codon:yes gene_type:complete
MSDKRKKLKEYLNDPKRAAILAKKGIDPKKLKKLADKYTQSSSGKDKKDVPLAMASPHVGLVPTDLMDDWEIFNQEPWRGRRNRPGTYHEWLKKYHPKEWRKVQERNKKYLEEQEKKKEKKKKKDDDDDEPPRSPYQRERDEHDIRLFEERRDWDHGDMWRALKVVAGAEVGRRMWESLPKKKIAAFLTRAAARHRTALLAGVAGPVALGAAQLVATTADAAEMAPSKKASAAARKKAAVKQQRRLAKKAKRWDKEGAVGLPESPSGSRTTDEGEGDE